MSKRKKRPVDLPSMEQIIRERERLRYRRRYSRTLKSTVAVLVVVAAAAVLVATLWMPVLRIYAGWTSKKSAARGNPGGNLYHTPSDR